MLPLFDPPRTDAKETIATAEALGVKVKMVTGDQVAIAQETAKTLGMGTAILDAAGLGDVQQQAADDGEAWSHRGRPTASPKGSLSTNSHIVDVLQQQGHIVGMTGDGVNDAPALKKADCGIAVSGATDGARAQASKIVLMSPGLSVIIDAIKESRRIVQRMNSYAIYRISETLRGPGFVTVAILVFNFFPVTAIMIVILALLERRLDSLDRLRQRALQAAARSLEHAAGARDVHGARPHRPYCRLWAVLPGPGSCFSPRPLPISRPSCI